MRKIFFQRLLILMVCFMLASPLLPAEVKKERGGEKTYVYITKNGKKYHCKCCSHIKKSSTKKRITLNEARRKNYGACATCEPAK